MPKDNTGKFHFNFGHAASATGGAMAKAKDGMRGKDGAKPSPGKPVESEKSEEHLGHHLMSQAHEKHPESSHMHIMSHGGGMHTTHHVHSDGEVQGPHEHSSDEEMNQHVAANMGEGGEQGDGEMMPSHMDSSLMGDGY